MQEKNNKNMYICVDGIQHKLRDINLHLKNYIINNENDLFFEIGKKYERY